eukprot:CAMPEP_0202689540 /NCGR_PEP_ID=MMETSP1385-20130828/4767_1 /ASSEMBLY_ACC=CAM_ASM_000861 /TAXON_ID=933848 /ORGANISM="Elphidium margaritaceum" /LENGTH=217 /DNA_ID=CAMNT_0049344681 /DNA_START=30 /DNA_END=683 /DNA_ORIENTATION=+
MASLTSPLPKVLETPSSISQPNKINRGDAQWMRDKEANQCKECGVEFSITVRKHHCRACGLISCDKCSPNRIQLKKSGKKSRVCNECFNQIAPRHMRSTSSLNHTLILSHTPSLLDTAVSNHDHDEQQLPPSALQPDLHHDNGTLAERHNENENKNENEHRNTNNIENACDNFQLNRTKFQNHDNELALPQLESPAQPLLSNDESAQCTCCTFCVLL